MREIRQPRATMRVDRLHAWLPSHRSTTHRSSAAREQAREHQRIRVSTRPRTKPASTQAYRPIVTIDGDGLHVRCVVHAVYDERRGSNPQQREGEHHDADHDALAYRAIPHPDARSQIVVRAHPSSSFFFLLLLLLVTSSALCTKRPSRRQQASKQANEFDRSSGDRSIKKRTDSEKHSCTPEKQMYPA